MTVLQSRALVRFDGCRWRRRHVIMYITSDVDKHGCRTFIINLRVFI